MVGFALHLHETSLSRTRIMWALVAMAYGKQWKVGIGGRAWLARLSVVKVECGWVASSGGCIVEASERGRWQGIIIILLLSLDEDEVNGGQCFFPSLLLSSPLLSFLLLESKHNLKERNVIPRGYCNATIPFHLS